MCWIFMLIVKVKMVVTFFLFLINLDFVMKLRKILLFVFYQNLTFTEGRNKEIKKCLKNLNKC